MTDQIMVGVNDGRAAVETTPATGTTTNSYVAAYSANLQWAHDTVIVVANTGATNNLTYQVLVYANHDSGESHILTSNTVVAGDTDEIILVRHSKIDVQVKSAVSGAYTTYQIDSIAGR